MFNRSGKLTSHRTEATKLISVLALGSVMARTVLAGSPAWINANATAHWTPRSGHSAVVFDEKMWILGGRDEQGPKNDVWCSIDGASWTLVTESAPWSARDEHASVVFGGRIWVIGGGGPKNDVWSSEDGAEWDQVVESAGWTARSRHTSVAFDGKLWIVGGSDENPNPEMRIHNNDVWRSEDGANWEAATPEAPWVGREDHTSLVLGDRVWVIGGQRALLGPDDSTGLSDVWFSEDGITWTMATEKAAWTNRAGHGSVVFHGELWLIGGLITKGIAGVEFQNDGWSSEDGAEWSEASHSAEWSARHGHASVSYDGVIWLLGGELETGSKTNDVWHTERPNPQSDMNSDGKINSEDLLMLLLEWQRVE